MKRITLLLLLFIMTGTVAYSQIPQNFEGGIPTGWARYNNAFGNNQWTTVNTVTTPPIVCEGTISAFVNGTENIGVGNTSEKWLVSTEVTVPDNGQLVFSTRSTINGFQNTTYQIRVSTVDQFSGFQIVASWTEAELTDVFNICEEKTVDLTGFQGQDIYIAFVLLVTQPTAAPTGDRWIVDDVRVVERCLNPENIQVGMISQVGATITWDNPSGAQLFEVEIVEFPNAPTGVGVQVGPATSYSPTNLNPTTQYEVYVRAICSESSSEWVGPANFTTSSPGLTCDSAIPIDSGLPYSTTDNTSNYSDDIDGSPGSSGCGATGNFLNGNNVYYSYTADFDGVVNVTMTPTGNNSGLFIYNSCANVGVSCIAGVANNTGTPRVIDLPVVAGQTYYIVISTSGTPATIPYTLALQVVNCPPPTNLGAVGGQTSAVLNWDANGATSWEYVVQTAGSAVPAGAGVQTNSFENVTVTTLFDSTPLVASSQYQYWVRRDCGDGTFSAWAGPFLFNTTICEPNEQCLYTFRMSDSFGDGWNGARMEIRQNGLVIATIGETFTGGNGPVDVTVSLCTGVPFELFWTVGGGFPGEVRIQVINPFDQILYNMNTASAGLVNTELYSGLVDCDNPACLPPDGVTVDNISDVSAEVSWTPIPGITQYEVIVLLNGDPAPGASSTGTITSDSPFLIEGLTAATIYNVYVRAICSTPTPSNWTPVTVFNTTICPVEDQCEYTFRMTDSFGDGWNGARMQIRQNGIVVATIGATFTGGTGPVDVVVPLCDGLPFDLFWSVGGTFAGEVRIEVINPFDQTLYNMNVASAGLVNTVLYTAMVDCDNPACLPPNNIVVSNVGQENAQVSWDAIPGFDNYEVIVVLAGSPAPADTDTGTVTTDNPFLLEGLTPSSSYTVYVRTLCSDTSISPWTIAPATFITTQIPAELNYAEDFEGTHGWSFVNGASVNRWTVGTATNNGGTHAMYISNDNGVSNTYTVGSAATTVHAYRDIAIPTAVNEGTLSFDWRALGESTFDYFRVWIVPTSFNPTQGTQITAGASGGVQLGANFNQNGNYTTQSYILSLAPYAGTTIRLVFEWRNDGSGGTQPPAAIDNINLSLVTCPSPIDLLPQTEIGSFAVDLSWTPVGTETQWEVFIQPLGSGAPAPDAVGIIVDQPNYNFLAEEDVFYEFYVRAICSEDDKSFWAGPEQFSIFIPPGCASVDVVGVGVDIVDGSVVVCPDSDIEEINLSASFYGIAATTSYAVESIEYAPPFPFVGGIQTSVNTDDVWSSAIDLPFNFCFFGQSYTQAKVGSNGVVQFGNGMADGGFCPWAYTQSVPDPAFPILNAIYGVYQDIDPNINNAFANPDINYQVLGTYPCRALVVNYSEVAQFSGACNNNPTVGAQTTQIVIYEISNIIEVYVQRRVPCTSWNGGRGVIGIQNATGTEGYTPPGRNTGTWSATDEAWRFLPNGESDVDFQWLMNGAFYSDQEDISIVLTPEQQQELETNLSLTLEMEAVATYATCTPGEEVTTSKTVDIVYIIEFPNNDPIDLESCSATSTAIFDLTQNNEVILGTFDPALFLFSYYLSEEDALVPQNPIENPEAFEGTDGQQIWVRVSDLTNTCSLVKSFFLMFGDDIVTPIVEFEYDPAVICVSSTSGLLLPTLATDFNTGGEFTSTAGLVIDSTTGEINLGTSTAGIYDVVYTLEPQGCTDGGTFTFTVELVNAVTPITEFSYDDTEYCKSGTNPVLQPAVDFDTSGQFSASPDGLAIDASTGAIDLATSAAGTYEITYLISSNTGVCEINESYTVTLTVIDVVDPVFDPITLTYCIGSTPDVLLPTSTNGITGTWSPAVIDTSVAVVDATYVFTPDEGQCANTVTLLVTVTEEVTPTFDPIGTAYCLNATPDALPTSTNGITGTWSPATIDTSIAVVDAAYVFTPDAGQCAVSVTLLITVSTEILPTFDVISVCQGVEPPVLPTTSLEGVTGTWSGVIDTSVPGMFDFTFTPDGTQECAIATTISVEVRPTVVATFEPITTTYCQGAMADALPVSNNSVPGTWSPAVIDTATLGEATYTFTPDASVECQDTTVITITISTPATPLFTALTTTYCLDDTPNALPSVSENGINGTWNPSAIDTSVPGENVEYVFTPAMGECADVVSVFITINDRVVPTFAQVGPLCVGETASLPQTSQNGITGTWSPAFSSATAGQTTYTFEPSEGICATTQTMTVEVIARPLVDTSVDQILCATDGDYVLPALTNGVYYSEPNGMGNVLTTVTVSTTPQTVYIFAQGTLAGCSSESSFTVTFVSVEADELSDVEECTRYFLPELSTGNAYYTGPGATGTQLFAGQALEEDQMVYIYAGTSQGCFDESSFEVVIKNCGIQKGISPNADGLNDFFDLTDFDVRKLSIFNRYGTKVYDRTNYSNQWYGQTNSGDELPDGTYYFVIEFNNIEAKTGWIYINRER
ncbi:fibronectin type III domain-containing protein [Flavobacterium sp.]|uniref:fibronectin type III domain-containing protein n=1 Tax=Flavobacterium sp. TaxID=239 RepID=UPI003527070C